MARVRASFSFPLAVAVALAAWGCNGTNIDEPGVSDSLLLVDNVTPASVQADVSPSLDPNTLLLIPPKDDTVAVQVRNRNRSQSGGGLYGDIILNALEVVCSNGSLNSSMNPACPGGFCPVSLTIPAASSATINVLVAAGPFKQANSGALLGIGSDLCQITFRGEDLGGEPVLSAEAVFGISYVDTP